MKNSTRTIDVNAGVQRRATRSFAQVFDTYQAPARSKSGLHSLGKALGLAGEAFQTAEIKRKAEAQAEAEAADKQRGLFEGLLSSMENDPNKIRNGEMFVHQSPAYVAGFNESMGQKNAYKIVQSWGSDYQSWEGRNSNDPAAFQNFMQERLTAAREAIGTDDHTITGAMPVLQMGINNLSQKHAAYTHKRMQEEDVQAMQIVSQGIMEGHDWEADPSGINLIIGLKEQADHRVARGLSGTLINQTMVEDVLSFADAHNDLRYLAALAKGHDEGFYRLSAKQMEMIDTKRLNIEAEIDQVARDNEVIRQKEATAARDGRANSYLDTLMVDPTAFPDRNLDAAEYKNHLALRSAFNQARTYVDPQVEKQALVGVTSMIYGPEFQQLSYSEKLSKLAPLLASPNASFSEATITGLMRSLKEKSDPKSIFKNATFTRLMGNSVSALNSLGSDPRLGTKSTQLSTAFQSKVDELLYEVDPAGKTPGEIKALFDAAAHQAVIAMLEDKETRHQLLSNKRDNEAIFRQFGVMQYVNDYYAANPEDEAADQLDDILSGGTTN